MIVWTGRGLLSIIVLVISFFLCAVIIPKEYSDYIFVLSAFIAGVFSWVFGKKWNLQNERIVIDEETGQRLKIKNTHTLFWIPMQYWGIIFFVFGIVVLFQNSVIAGVVFSTILMLAIASSLIKKKSTLNTENTFNEKKENQIKINKEEKQRLKLEKEQIRKEKEDSSRFMPK